MAREKHESARRYNAAADAEPTDLRSGARAAATLEARIDMYERRLVLDKRTLDDDLQVQPSLYYEVGELLNEAQAEHAKAVAYLKTVEADLDGQVRAEAAAAGDKATEKAVEQKVQSHPKRLAAQGAMLATKRTVDRFANLKDAYAQRSKALSELGALYAANYFTVQSVRGTERQADDRAYRDARAAQADARRTRHDDR